MNRALEKAETIAVAEAPLTNASATEPASTSLTLRLVIAASLWSLVTLALVGIVLSSLFRDAVNRAFDTRLMVFLETLVANAEVRPDGGLVVTEALGDPRFDEALSGWYWQIEGTHGVGAPAGPDWRSRSLWDKVLVPPRRTKRDEPARADMQGPLNQNLRVIARDIVLPGSDLPFVFTIAGDKKELQDDIARFDRLLTSALAALGIGLVLGIVGLVRLGLAPLRRVSRSLADIRSGRTARLAGRFPSEINPLAEELNALVDHNAALLERARRHMGNLAHALKTPISVMLNEADAPGGPATDTLKKQLAIMGAQVDHQLTRARAAASGGLITSRTQVAPVLADLQRTLQRIHAKRGIDIAVEAPDGLVFKGEREDFEEMVGNLMDNACKWAKTRVLVRGGAEAGTGGPTLSLAVEDDGPGLDESGIAKVMKRGARLDETVPGSGLGLSIVRDLAELYGGKLQLTRSELGGLKSALALPAAEVAG